MGRCGSKRDASEDLNEAERQFADFDLFFQIDTDIDGSDIVTDEEDGVMLEIVGPPARFTQSGISHIEAKARAIDQQETS